LAYLAALGIGALRPFGKRSELLLLPFSPWLFVTVAPLSLAAFQVIIAQNDYLRLMPPISMSVPMLFVLTLFFKGQAAKWRAAGSGSGAFFTQLILPSLPLVLLLLAVGLLVGMKDPLWPLLVGTGPGMKMMTAGTALIRLSTISRANAPVVAAGITVFEAPVFLCFFVIFGALQCFYLDRLALTNTTGSEQ
jgi:hypothetical protein